MSEYVYRGDRWTRPDLRGARCSAVRILNTWGQVTSCWVANYGGCWKP